MTLMVAVIVAALSIKTTLQNLSQTEQEQTQAVSSIEQEGESSAEKEVITSEVLMSGGENEAESSAMISMEMERKPYTVVIDAGHQLHGNSEQEPIGEGATETKSKVSSGTMGCVSGLNEYELTLAVSLQLQDELEARGYAVIMTRISNDVDMSNAERAGLANQANADAFLRIHANGSENHDINGAMTICQTVENPYNAECHDKSYALSMKVLDALVEETGCQKQYVWETDTMSGVNWCKVPVTIVEMGYMSNPEEDARMATAEYQSKLAIGIANGVDAYLGGVE